MSKKIVRTIHASMLRFCADFAAEHPGLTVVNFDAHGDEATIPTGDLVGMSGLSWDVDDHFLNVNVMFGISTTDDSNLFRLIELLDPLYESLLPTKLIPAYDADTGEKVGVFIMQNGTRALPVGGSSSRPLQYIMVGMSSTTTFSLS